MLTVVLAEQDHLTFINEHQAFLRPFLKGQDFVLCPWNPNAKDPELAIPTLQEKVGETEDWRLVVLWVDPKRIHDRNPFDVIPCVLPKREELKKDSFRLRELEEKESETQKDLTEEQKQEAEKRKAEEEALKKSEKPLTEEEKQKKAEEEAQKAAEDRLYAYNERILEPLTDYILKKEHVLTQAYHSAANQPLTMLATWLCDSPTISHNELTLSEEEKRQLLLYRPHEYAEFLLYQEYRREIIKKEEVRKEIRENAIITVHKPKEFYCVTFRTIRDEESHIKNGWKEQERLNYSHFTDWNMYFDNMRFILYDIPEKTKQDYWSEYISFIYSLLIFATNPHPSGVFDPRTVYKMQCEANRAILEDLINSYENKLKNTQDILYRREQTVLNRQKESIQDSVVRSIFLNDTDKIRIALVDPEGEKQIEIDTDEIGLSVDPNRETDTFNDQEQFWIGNRRQSDSAFRLFMRLPVRMAEKAADDFHVHSAAELDDVGKMNHFQIHDVEKFVEDKELQMLDVDVVNPEPTEVLEKRIKETGDQVLDQIRQRMSQKQIMTFLFMTIGVTFLSMMVMFLNLNSENFWSVPVIIVMIVLFLGVFGLAGFGYLLYSKHKIKKAYLGYNDTVKEITNGVSKAMQTYSHYLSNACDVMRGNHVVDYYNSMEDPAEAEVRIFRKHRMDIEKKRLELREVYGQYLMPNYQKKDELDYFDWDYSKGKEYSYDIAYTDASTEQILFLIKGNYVEIPVGFIRSITIRREEIYE